jgi:hypothetical protein
MHNASSETQRQAPELGRRIALLVACFFLNLPGWIAGVYLVLKWTGVIRGMSRENELGAAWGVLAFFVAFLGAAIAVLLAVGSDGTSGSQLGGSVGLLLLAFAVACGFGVFRHVKANGGPQVTRNPDWRGFAVGCVVAFVAISISLNTYTRAAGQGGTFVLAWGPALWGIYKALKSLRRPDFDPVSRRG